MTIRPVWTIGPGRFWQALYPSLLSITMVYPEKVRTQFLSLRHRPGQTVIRHAKNWMPIRGQI